MTFTTPQFVLFLLLFLWIFTSFADHHKKWCLLISSYLFYAVWSVPFILLILSSTLLDYWVGRALNTTPQDHSLNERRRKRLLMTSLVFNLGALIFFKYSNFFIESSLITLNALGLDISYATLNIVLPVGISFYTFQTLSYTIDIYRGRLTPSSSLLDFALYVAYFPQLVAGPIERASRLLPQIKTLNQQRRADLSGWGLIALGAFKKAVIADHCATLVDTTYASPEETFPLALWIGTYAFAIQIYCDFSGYSDIAVGVSRLIGIELTQNFDAPYASRTPSEFWKRWHISLSSWLRDYLYIPLGGNRGGWWHVRRNLTLTMLLGGLWHGAAWHFIVWGVFHATLLIIYKTSWVKYLSEALHQRNLKGPLNEVFQRLFFFHLICISWVLFRAPTLSDAVIIIRKLVCFWDWDIVHWIQNVNASGEGQYLVWMMGTMMGLVLVQNIWKVNSKIIVSHLWRLPEFLRVTIIVSVLYVTMIFAPERPPPFIYFQF